MSLEALHTEVQSYRTEAGEIAEDFSRVQAEISNDPGLTPSGKRERLEPLHQQVTEQMSALLAREKAAVKAEKEKLERRVFGLTASASSDPAKIDSFRKAQALARELDDSDEASDIYESAKRSGDTILAAAVLEKALIRGWTQIKDDHLSRNPSTRDDLDDLTALAKYSNNGLSVTAQYMPPSLNLPHSASFPDLKQHKRRTPRGVPSLGDVMAQRLGLS